ncbi:hypothetical protein BH11CYA1_BH11CYA1_33020 [soil metagenome]
MLYELDNPQNASERKHGDASHKLSEQAFALTIENNVPAAIEGAKNKVTPNDDTSLEKASKRLAVLNEAAYKGEEIKLSVAPAVHICASKEQFGKIARNQLGDQATDKDVATYVREIGKLNNIPEPAKHHLVAGELLNLPGHTSDGKMFTTNHLPRELDGNGNMVICSQGRRPEENFSITVAKDKSMQVSDSAGSKFEFSSDAAIKHDRAELLGLAGSKVKAESEFAKFVVDLAKFENRAAQQKMPTSEVHNTYQQIARLLSDDKTHVVGKNHKIILAEQILNHAATPTTVEQGDHPTCNVANVESRMYARKPSEAARLVADLALTSRHVTADGVIISYDNQSATSLLPHNESRTHPPADGDRSYASQLFQLGAVTSFWNSDAKKGAGLTVRYEEGEKTATDAKEGIFLYQGNKRSPFSDSPSLGVTDLEPIYNRIAGTREHGFVIQRANHDWEGSARFETLTGLEKRLSEAKEKNLYPAILMVDTNNEPFAHDSGADRQNAYGGSHVVSVTDYDANSKRVAIDGTWTASADHFGENRLSSKDIYYSAFEPIGVDGKANMKDVRELNDAVAHNRRAGTVDPVLELSSVRFNKFALQYERSHAAGYVRDFNSALKEVNETWGGGLSGATPQERDRALRNVVDIVRSMNTGELAQVRNTAAWKQIKPLFKDYIAKNCEKSDPVHWFAAGAGMVDR